MLVLHTIFFFRAYKKGENAPTSHKTSSIHYTHLLKLAHATQPITHFSISPLLFQCNWICKAMSLQVTWVCDKATAITSQCTTCSKKICGFWHPRSRNPNKCALWRQVQNHFFRNGWQCGNTYGDSHGAAALKNGTRKRCRRHECSCRLHLLLVLSFGTTVPRNLKTTRPNWHLHLWCSWLFSQTSPSSC